MMIQKRFIVVIHNRAMLTHQHIDLYQLMIKIFDQIQKFKYTQDILYTSALEEYHRRQSAPDDMEDQPPLISTEIRQQLKLL